MAMQENFLPVILHPDTDLALVVGGGAKALGKVRWLREHGWRLRLVAPVIDEAIRAQAGDDDAAVTLTARPWNPGDLDGVAVVIAATGSPAIDAAVSSEARRRGLPVNVVDVPDLCTFFVPGCIRRGPLEIAVTTGGANPALAARIRGELAEAYPAWYADYAEALRWARERVQERCPDPVTRRRVLGHLASRACADELHSLRGEMLRRAVIDRVDRVLRRESGTDAHPRRATEG